MKIIATYQQTFTNTSAGASATFNFTRVYKSDPKYKVKITVSSLSYEVLGDTTEYTPACFFLSGVGELTGRCMNQRQNGLVTNDWTLGVCGENSSSGSKSASLVSESPSLIVDELPLYPFTIYLEEFDGTSYSSSFRVVFNIEVVEL